MSTSALPKADRIIKIEAADYTCPVTGDVWKRPGFEVRCSNDLVHTVKSYGDSLALVPQGYRMSSHEIIAYLAQRVKELKAEGRNQREALQDELFDRQIRGKPYRWEHTHMLLKPPKGAKDFTKYTETDSQGNQYSRADQFIGNKLVAEGALMPHGSGSKVVEINPALGLPSVVSDGDEPQHVMHSYFEPKKSEVAAGLYDGWYDDGHYGCLNFDADYGRSVAGSNGAFRVVQGSLEDTPLPSCEQYIKDMASFEKGVHKGIEQGKQIGLEAGKQIGIQQMLADITNFPIEKVLRKYKQ